MHHNGTLLTWDERDEWLPQQHSVNSAFGNNARVSHWIKITLRAVLAYGLDSLTQELPEVLI